MAIPRIFSGTKVHTPRHLSIARREDDRRSNGFFNTSYQKSCLFKDRSQCKIFWPIVRLARFDKNRDKSTKQWLATVRRHMAKAGPANTPKIYAVLYGLVMAFEEYKIFFQGVGCGERLWSQMPAGTAPGTWKCYERPSQLLASRFGNCVSSSILMATTLSRLGFKAALIMDERSHIVPAAISTKARIKSLAGIKLPGTKLYVYPIESNFIFKSDFNLTMAYSIAHKFVKECFRLYGSKIVSLQGKILWQRKWRGPLFGDPRVYGRVLQKPTGIRF